MAKVIRRWHPDTCECITNFSFDDEAAFEDNIIVGEPFENVCQAHKSLDITDHNKLYWILRDESAIRQFSLEKIHLDSSLSVDVTYVPLVGGGAREIILDDLAEDEKRLITLIGTTPVKRCRLPIESYFDEARKLCICVKGADEQAMADLKALIDTQFEATKTSLVASMPKSMTSNEERAAELAARLQ